MVYSQIVCSSLGQYLPSPSSKTPRKYTFLLLPRSLPDNPHHCTLRELGRSEKVDWLGVTEDQVANTALIYRKIVIQRKCITWSLVVSRGHAAHTTHMICLSSVCQNRHCPANVAKSTNSKNKRKSKTGRQKYKLTEDLKTLDTHNRHAERSWARLLLAHRRTRGWRRLLSCFGWIHRWAYLANYLCSCSSFLFCLFFKWKKHLRTKIMTSLVFRHNYFTEET